MVGVRGLHIYTFKNDVFFLFFRMKVQGYMMISQLLSLRLAVIFSTLEIISKCLIKNVTCN